MAGGVSQIELTKVAFDQAVESKEEMIKKTAKVIQIIDDIEVRKLLEEFIVQDEQHVKMLKDKMDKLHLV
ncbi:hypothetical protein [Desulfuribacillus alkaliarsenatis]|uniref:Uncharacterized protein n=1 Tax=Desulfuribacillus alkaliarsenatis TaxID=766136 RepID=A0A1E5G4V1_9FIRM|nr:hypothetical protein [Desulfuribacillus alkaliarsenatis]OEF98208.1 hypothetical protein BHF68_00530 [Desulfuribacillus alkaliarsenatis]